ncbi:O-antigen ligase family protein [Flavobacteriales bacterium]|nr:O-antigen ligase family protein [Flavobacteriales bacterium]
MNKIVNKAQQIFFVILGITIPTSIAITNIVIFALALCWVIEGDFYNKIKTIKSSKWMVSIFGLIVLYGLGIFWGDIHANVSWQFQRLALLLIFPILATIDLTQKTIRNGAIAFLITTFISAVVAIGINCNIILPLGEYTSLINKHHGISAFIVYNYHNVLLALATTLALFILLEKKTKYRNVILFFIAVYAISIFTEPGRAGQVIFNLSSLFYIVYYNSKSLFRLIAFVLLLFSFQYVVYKTTKVYKKRLDAVAETIKNTGYLDSTLPDIRYVFVRESLKRIFEKPLLGHGTGSFGAIFDKEVKTGHKFYSHITPHNQYLYVWFELGILGLILLLMIFYHQIKELFKKQDGAHRTLLPLSFLFLMLVDSYFFIFILTIAYIYLYIIYSRFQSE